MATGMTHSATGVMRPVSGVMRVATGVTQFAVGVMRAATRMTRIAAGVMRPALVVSCEETAVSPLPVGGVELPSGEAWKGKGVFRVNAEGARGSARPAQILTRQDA